MKSLLSKLFGTAKKTSRPSVMQQNRARLQVEGLESRQLMSASPIAAPIAKPIMGPAMVSQPMAAQTTTPQKHSSGARTMAPASPLTYYARQILVNEMVAKNVLIGAIWNDAGNAAATIAYLLRYQRSLANAMSSLERAEPYYARLGYDESYFKAYVAQFRALDHMLVQAELYYWNRLS